MKAIRKEERLFLQTTDPCSVKLVACILNILFLQFVVHHRYEKKNLSTTEQFGYDDIGNKRTVC